MRDLCNTDKPLFAVLTKLTYSAYLNILWLVCSLPIVTIGASTTALFYVTLKMAEDRDEYENIIYSPFDCGCCGRY